ncbi:MAG: phospholipase/carboxylesterase [Bacteroidetes bacterium]|nr:MAG: phospholipase/carboxylesterase [Bacteroidota bacterium]
MKQHQVTVPKTARYFTLGEAGPATKNVWFLCHGYGQLANYFLRNFEPLNDGTSLLVAPEGLHRFYVNGVSGRIGASWMTKEDRLSDISDYTGALDILYDEVMRGLPADTRIHVLGFSQGSATVSRWLAAGSKRFDTLTLWCGFFPPDMNWEKDLARFMHSKNFIVTASQDEFISAEQEEEQLRMFREKQVPFSHLRFEGKHVIDPGMLRGMRERIV